MQKNHPGPSITTESSITDEVDWSGNSCLHNLFATPTVDIHVLKRILQQFPHLPEKTNLSGRIPLHYAVDHGKVNMEAIQLLLDAFPEGMTVKDQDDISPYDLVVKWDHPKALQWLFLSRFPSLDHDQYLKLKYGPFGSLAVWATSHTHGEQEGFLHPVDSDAKENPADVTAFDQNSDSEGESQQNSFKVQSTRRVSVSSVHSFHDEEFQDERE